MKVYCNLLHSAGDNQGPEVRRGIEAAVSTVKGVKQAHGAIRAEKMLTADEVETLLAALSEGARASFDSFMPRAAGSLRLLACGSRIATSTAGLRSR